MRPSLRSDSAESEHSFIEVHHLSVRITYLLQKRLHSMEDLAVMRFGEVDLSLASLNVFKPNFVLQVNATDG